MRLVGILCVAVLVSAIYSAAQQKPLGDVAREFRAKKSGKPPAAKVITNDDLPGSAPTAAPINADENPIEVVGKARTALIHDTDHVCHFQATGNSGPGWTDERLVEIAGSGRSHITLTKRDGAQTENSEYIAIEEHVYRRTGNGGWDMPGWNAGKFAEMMQGAEIPDTLQFGYQPGDLRLVGKETIDGVSTFRYEANIHPYDMNRTISIWIGVNDGLLRRTDMVTVTPSLGLTSRETTSCSYGGKISIEAPM